MSLRIIDTHVHVWCRGNGPECRPSSTARIPIPSDSAPVEWLIDDMERTGISYAVLVQSSAFGANNRYIVECLDRFPGKFRAIGLVHPLDIQAPRRLREWASRGVSGFRFHPVFFEDASWLDAPSSDRIWEAAEDTESILQFHMRPSHAGMLASIASRHPNVKVIVDHLGKPDLSTAGGERPILALADLPHVWMKIGDYQIASQMDYPWPDLKPLVARLCERFGTDRMIWGTGFAGRARLVPLEHAIDLVKNHLDLSPIAIDDICWRTPRALFGFEEAAASGVAS
jgi:predicted TIM-barrel fold metal-dependent hydrolase